MAGQVVCVDVETSGFDLAIHEIVEVAWWNLDTDERGEFVPPHNSGWVMAHGRPEALAANRYVQRLVTAKRDTEGTGAVRLLEQLTGNTLAGANPKFDVRFLTKLFTGYGPRGRLSVGWTVNWPPPLLDVSAVAAQVLGLKVKGLLGLPKLCELLGIEPGDHSAAGDVRATGECLKELWRRSSVG